jgi:hypothetical protein
MNKDLYWETGLGSKFEPTSWGPKQDLERETFLRKWHQDWLVDPINSLDPKLVIDAGCGTNPWKNVIRNLIGFDASPFPNSDFQSTIIDANFEKDSADALLLLGSLQFFNLEYIEENFAKALTWVKPGGLIFMRVIKQWDLYTKKQKESKFKDNYFWSSQDIDYITNKYNLEFFYPVQTIQMQNLEGKKIKNPYRMYWTWKKS